MFKIILILLTLVSCKTLPVRWFSDDVSSVEKAQEYRIEQAETLSKNGWVIYEDCDSYLWSSLLQSGVCSRDYNPRWSQTKNLGIFNRRPGRSCFDPKKPSGAKQESKTSWSHDMGLGLTLYSISCGNRTLLEDHLEGAKRNHWVTGIGDPISVISRAIYRPSMQATLYTARNGLGGEYNHIQEANFWKSGLVDYQAHLQMIKIEIHLRAKGKITPLMYRRIKEHYQRDKKDPYFASLYAITSGDYKPALDLCSKKELDYYGEYVRCHDTKRCELAHFIHACGLLMDHFKKVEDAKL